MKVIIHLLGTICLFLFLIKIYLIFYEKNQGYPRKNENIEDVIFLYEKGENILALRCYRRVFKNSSLKEAKVFLEQLGARK